MNFPRDPQAPAVAEEVIERMGKWFAHAYVLDEVGSTVPVPRELRAPVAREMVTHPMFGWPDERSALAYLDEYYEWDRE